VLSSFLLSIIQVGTFINSEFPISFHVLFPASFLSRAWNGAGRSGHKWSVCPKWYGWLFDHWNHFPLASDLASLSHHPHPDKFLLVPHPTSCFHFFYLFFLRNSGFGRGWSSCTEPGRVSCRVTQMDVCVRQETAKASSSVLQDFDVLMRGSQKELQPRLSSSSQTLFPFPSSTRSCCYLFLSEAAHTLGLAPLTALLSTQRQHFSIQTSQILTTQAKLADHSLPLSSAVRCCSPACCQWQSMIKSI